MVLAHLTIDEVTLDLVDRAAPQRGPTLRRKVKAAQMQNVVENWDGKRASA